MKNKEKKIIKILEDLCKSAHVLDRQRYESENDTSFESYEECYCRKVSLAIAFLEKLLNSAYAQVYEKSEKKFSFEKFGDIMDFFYEGWGLSFAGEIAYEMMEFSGVECDEDFFWAHECEEVDGLSYEDHIFKEWRYDINYKEKVSSLRDKAFRDWFTTLTLEHLEGNEQLYGKCKEIFDSYIDAFLKREEQGYTDNIGLLMEVIVLTAESYNLVSGVPVNLVRVNDPRVEKLIELSEKEGFGFYKTEAESFEKNYKLALTADHNCAGYIWSEEEFFKVDIVLADTEYDGYGYYDYEDMEIGIRGMVFMFVTKVLADLYLGE